MKTKSEWGNCLRCGKEITDNNVGDYITEEEILVCDSCSDKHRLSIIEELEKFRQGKEFNSILGLRKRMLWVSEQMGNWHDTGDKSYIESVADYNDWTIKELQSAIIDCEINLIENAIYEDELEGIEKKFDNEEQKEKLKELRKELLKHLRSI